MRSLVLQFYFLDVVYDSRFILLFLKSCQSWSDLIVLPFLPTKTLNRLWTQILSLCHEGSGLYSDSLKSNTNLKPTSSHTHSYRFIVRADSHYCKKFVDTAEWSIVWMFDSSSFLILRRHENFKFTIDNVLPSANENAVPNYKYTPLSTTTSTPFTFKSSPKHHFQPLIISIISFRKNLKTKTVLLNDNHGFTFIAKNVLLSTGMIRTKTFDHRRTQGKVFCHELIHSWVHNWNSWVKFLDLSS